MALTPEEMEQIPNAISNAFSELEIGIFEDLIGRIKENNEITGTAEYDIFKLIQLGESEKVIKNYVRKALKITYSEIEEIFGDVFETGYNRDNDLFKAVGADFIAYKDNEPLQQYIAAIKEQTRGTYKNITNTMGFVRQREGTKTWVPLTKYYKDSLTRAVIEITSGSFSYTQVVKKIINEMTNSGIRTIDYASGRTNRIEVAALRAIQTAVTQVAAKVTEQNMEKLHTEYVEVSWHATARPTHQVWQGRVFKWNRNNDAANKTQNTDKKKTDDARKEQWENVRFKTDTPDTEDYVEEQRLKSFFGKPQDITQEWKKTDQKIGKIEDMFEYTINDKTYNVDGKKVLLDYSIHEKNIAQLIANEAGKNIKMVPRITYPQGIQTPDYLIDGARFDLKTPLGNGKNTIYGMVKSKKRQANNFVICADKTELNIEELQQQILDIYHSKNTSFVDTIILVKDNKIINVYKRNK